MLTLIPTTPPLSQSLYYKGHSISDSQSQCDEFVENRNKLIDKLVGNINSHFPDGGLIMISSILDPQNVPVPADLPSYDNSEINTCLYVMGV